MATWQEKRGCASPFVSGTVPLFDLTPTCTLIWLWWCWEKKCNANFHYDNLQETEEQIRYESRMLCHRRDEKIKCKQLVSGIDCCYEVQCDIHQYNLIIIFCVTQLYSNVAVATFAKKKFSVKKMGIGSGLGVYWLRHSKRPHGGSKPGLLPRISRPQEYELSLMQCHTVTCKQHEGGHFQFVARF